MKSARLQSWGNYPALPQTPIACHWRGELAHRIQRARQEHGTTLPYGAGLSYGDSCLAASGHVLLMRPLDRFLSADWSTGVIAAEAGVTLEEVLAVAIPRGWFLAVTPGTKYVTLGGAIANDVHGKNHHRRGTIGRYVRRLGLLRTESGSRICTPEEDSALFGATIGGLGLTGLIEWAEIQLIRIGSSQLRCVSQRFGCLDEFFAISDELDGKHEYCVSWIDCSAKGKALGRGVYLAGDFDDSGPLCTAPVRRVGVPFTPPASLVNSASLRAFNGLYWRSAARVRSCVPMNYDPFFYPLDAVKNWNRMYGPRGFQQYQALLPESEARAGVQEMLKAIAETGTGSFLAVLKRCGDVPSPGLLSFPRPGTTLALDFPESGRPRETIFPRLDAIIRQAGGRMYPAKDAHMSGEDFRRMYPEWQQLEAMRDPALLSHFWKRVLQ